MKYFLPIVLFFITGVQLQAQNNDLLQHYEAFYKQMKKQGDMQGVVNALTHLDILKPSQAIKDTIAYIYANTGNYMQALNTIGIDKNTTASNLHIETKAVALKELGQVQRAIEQYEILYLRQPNPYIAYTLADLKIQTGDIEGANSNITYGLTSTTDEMKYAFYESQPPYEVPLKAAFIYLKALIQLNKDQNNLDAAIAVFDEAITIAPNFNLAKISKQALESRKEK